LPASPDLRNSTLFFWGAVLRPFSYSVIGLLP
jgi:hypothetical protein